MSDRNWEAELAKIDKQLASVSDEQLLADRKAVAAPAGKGAAPAAPARSSAVSSSGAGERTWVSWLKVAIAVGAAAGLMFWPWPARCGIPLVGFTAATGAVSLLGIWSAIGTWRHRLGWAHFASILVTSWGLLLGAREVLPRVGYAIPTIERAGQWTCDGLPPLPPTIKSEPAGSTIAPPAGSPSGGAPSSGSPTGQSPTSGSPSDGKPNGTGPEGA